MPKGDGSEKKCFEMWKSGLALSEIEGKTTALPSTVKMWVRSWERGAQKEWEANIHE
jgi:hypothetical protein